MSDTRSREPVLLSLHERFLSSFDTVGFVFAVRQRYTTGTLVRLAAHSERRVRRAAVFALGFVGHFDVNDTVSMAMLDDDPMVRSLAEQSCRRIWSRDGTTAQRRRLTDVVRANSAQQYVEADQLASALLEETPGFAEVWFQRGAARYQLGDLARALQDWHQTLELNAYHFLAATAMGEAYLQLSCPREALACFRRALGLNPGLQRVRDLVADLTRGLK